MASHCEGPAYGQEPRCCEQMSWDRMTSVVRASGSVNVWSSSGGSAPCVFKKVSARMLLINSLPLGWTSCTWCSSPMPWKLGRSRNTAQGLNK